MEQITLKELRFQTRDEAIGFLKKLWNNEGAACPICGASLELLHKKKKNINRNDWQCKRCDKTFKTLNLLNEINRQMLH